MRRAWANAHVGSVEAAMVEIGEALASRFPQARFETLVEAADVVGSYIDPDRGRTLLAEAEAVGARTAAERTYFLLFRSESLNRLGRPEEALDLLAAIPEGQHTGYPGFYCSREAGARGSAILARGPDVAAKHRRRPGPGGAPGSDRRIANSPASRGSRRRDPAAASSALVALWAVEPGIVIALAEVVLSRPRRPRRGALAIVHEAVERRPARWLAGSSGCD